MQMRTGGPAGGAHGADVLTLANMLAFANVDAAQMPVHRQPVVAVIDINDVAETVLNARKLNHAITNAAHRCAGWAA